MNKLNFGVDQTYLSCLLLRSLIQGSRWINRL
ncbi:MAG: hypothetical protein ACI8VT_003409 [Saprospiraceae bacterium]